MELIVDGLGVEKLVLLLVIVIEEGHSPQIQKTKKQPKKSV